jgi:hypothetical protein
VLLDEEQLGVEGFDGLTFSKEVKCPDCGSKFKIEVNEAVE